MVSRIRIGLPLKAGTNFIKHDYSVSLQEIHTFLAKRVLLISPYFPPHNTIGTKRAINFVQGVHEKEDWEVAVLASRPFGDKNDPRLIDQIPNSVTVNYGFVGLFRPLISFLAGGSKKKKPSVVPSETVIAPKKKPSNKKPSKSWTPFDQYLWDVGSAVRNGKRLIKKWKPDVIWVNADPWSGFLVADKLSRKFGIPWVADLRDPWTVFEKKMELRPTVVANTIRRYERKFFTSAAKIVLNTETACEAYKKVYPDLEGKFTFIRNAFNNRLLKENPANESDKVFTFGYYGGFRRFVPSTSLLKGYASFIKKLGLKSNQVRLEVRGSVYTDFWDQVDEFGLEDYVTVKKEIKQDDTIAHLRSWDVLLLSAVHDFRWMVSAKFYDYLFTRKPILAASDNDELNRLIDETKSGSWARTGDSEKIVQLFEAYYQKGKTNLLANEVQIEPFSLASQADRFRQVLNEVNAS